MSVEALFTPFQLKGLTLKNRVVMAPMTRSFSPDGIPTDKVAAYYQRRADADVGLIVSEAAVIDRPAACSDPKAPRFFGDEALAGWKAVVDEVHASSGLMVPQLWHMGSVFDRRSGHPQTALVDAPSGLSSPGKKFGEPMSDAAIADSIRAFVDAAISAQALGFDGVEVHAAHGYLLDQFFWQGTNERDDRYGGDLVGRSRLAAEIVREIRASVGPDFPILLRISQWKLQAYEAKIAQSPDDILAWLLPLIDAGVDCIDCSQRRFWEPEFEGSDLNLAGWVKKLTGLPTITVGSVGLTGEFIGAFHGEGSQPASLDELLRRFDRGDFDLVAVGRALLKDPLWAVKIRNGRTGELESYTPDAANVLY